MSDSISKYYELMEKDTTVETSPEQKTMNILRDIILCSYKTKTIKSLMNKSHELSQKHSNLPALACIQIAADELKVDELCK
jgi:hypothetical protein